MRLLLRMIFVFAVFVAASAYTKPQRGELIVFVDTSGSISQPAFANSVILLRKIAVGWPGWLQIYPITINAGSVNAVYDGSGFGGGNNEDDEVESFNSAVAALTKTHEASLKKNIPESCILSSLELLGQKVEAFRGPVQVIYLSDMLEECRNTPAGEPITLQRVDATHSTPSLSRVGQKFQFDSADRSLQKLAPKPDYLKKCHIALIVPEDVQETGWDDLNKFWRKVLGLYGYPDAAQLQIRRNTLPADLKLAP
jgi:hypothetical protein